MINVISLDKNFSTTRFLTKEKLIIKHRAEDKLEPVLFLAEGDNRKGEGGLRTKGYFKKSYGDKPLVSIITVVFNGGKYLEETIQSVIKQSYDNVEYIIIDGGSTDGTLDIIKKYEAQIDYWVSEKDTGIYDAMNKGLQLSCGKVVGIINADDYYMNDAIDTSIKTLLDTDADYTFGDVRIIPSNIIVSATFPLKSKIYQGMMYPHISAFIKKEVYNIIGLFNTQYKISADFDMAMRIHIGEFRAVYVEQIIGNIHEGGVSSGNLTKKENMDISVQYGRNILLAKVLYLSSRIKVLLLNYLPLSFVKFVRKYKKSQAQYE